MTDDDGPPLHDLLEALEADLPRELRGALAPRLWWEERGGFIHLPDCPERLRGAHGDPRPEVQLHASLVELLLRDALTSSCCAPPEAAALAPPSSELLSLASAAHRARSLLEELAAHPESTLHASLCIELLSTCVSLRTHLSRTPASAGLAGLAGLALQRSRALLSRALTSSLVLREVLEEATDDMEPALARAFVAELLSEAPRARLPSRERTHLVLPLAGLARREELGLAWCLGEEVLEAEGCILLRLDAALAGAFARTWHVVELPLPPGAWEDGCEAARLALGMRPELAAVLLEREPVPDDVRLLLRDSLDAAARALSP